MKIGIIGHGFVGQAIEDAFIDKCSDVLVNDPKYNSLTLFSRS